MKTKFKKYFLYASGEIILVTIGILLALYINNVNNTNSYKKKIDKNIVRVYKELEVNIDQIQEQLQFIHDVDSMIYLYMSNQLVKEDYYKDIRLSTMAINSNSLELEDEAYKNLIQLNIEEDIYQDELIAEIQELYSLNYKIKLLNDKLSSFVYNIILDNAETYEILAYHGKVDDEIIDYFMNSKTHRAHIIQYATVVVRNKLRRIQLFHHTAIGAYNKISNDYKLENKYNHLYDKDALSLHAGTYIDETEKDTLEIIYADSSLQVVIQKKYTLDLVPFKKNKFYMKANRTAPFYSFYNDIENNSKNIRISLLSNISNYKKIEKSE